jgi:hypothetical protein
MMKGEDTKESWCRWSCQAERHKSSKHRNQDGECTATFSFYVISGSDLFHSPHGGREFFGATLMHPS